MSPVPVVAATCFNHIGPFETISADKKCSNIAKKLIESYETENDLTLDLVEHKAIFHKTCMARYDSHKATAL